MARKPIKYREIAKALSMSHTNCAALPTLVYRLSRNAEYIERALNHMIADGLVRKTGKPPRELYELMAADIPNVSVEADLSRGPDRKPPPAPKPVIEPAVDQVDDQEGEDAEDEPDFAAALATSERDRAALLWAERMGGQRWHDDPRALREKPRTPPPPFYTNAARDA